MIKSKLIELLQTLETEELSQFLHYVESPLFNKKVNLIKMLQYLKLHHPRFPSAFIEKEHVSKSIFPDLPYDEKQIRYEMSYLTKLLEDFLAFQSYRKQGHARDYYLLESLKNKKNDKYFSHSYQKTLSREVKSPLKNAETYFRLFQIKELANQHFLQKRERKFDANIQDASDFLDLFYLSQKLRYSCNMLDRQKLLAQQYQINFSEEFTSMIDQSDFELAPDLEVYFKVYEVINDTSERKGFQHILSLLETNNLGLSEKDQKEIYFYLINYCARKIREGLEGFVEKALSLYLKGIESGVLFDDGFLSPWTFKNIVSLGLQSGEYEWVNNFINDYIKSIHVDFQKDALHFNKSQLSFHQGKYEQTLYHLQQLKHTDIYYNLDRRLFTIKSYFHLGEIDPLLSGIASFTTFLNRNKEINKTVKSAYLNFCKLLFNIIKSEKKKKLVIFQKIMETKQVVSKQWLLSIYDVDNNFL